MRLKMSKLRFLAILAATVLAIACNSAKNETSAAASVPASPSTPATTATEPPQGEPAQPPAPVITDADKARAMRPPAGSRLALVVFEDLECPACGRAELLLESAQANYKIPIVRHDFLIPAHQWSADAHVIARYFDAISPQLGEEFRRYMLTNQAAIYRQNLREWVDRFAAQHHQALPAFYDTSGELRAKVLRDCEVGRQLKVVHTPTVYLVNDSSGGITSQEVTDLSTLFQMIDQKLAELRKQSPGGRAK